jgi:hypothetical protein
MLTLERAHDVSSGSVKNEILGPWLPGCWVSGLLQSDRRCNLGDSWERKLCLWGIVAAVPDSPDPSECLKVECGSESWVTEGTNGVVGSGGGGRLG